MFPARNNAAAPQDHSHWDEYLRRVGNECEQELVANRDNVVYFLDNELGGLGGRITVDMLRREGSPTIKTLDGWYKKYVMVQGAENPWDRVLEKEELINRNVVPSHLRPFLAACGEHAPKSCYNFSRHYSGVVLQQLIKVMCTRMLNYNGDEGFDFIEFFKQVYDDHIPIFFTRMQLLLDRLYEETNAAREVQLTVLRQCAMRYADVQAEKETLQEIAELMEQYGSARPVRNGDIMGQARRKSKLLAAQGFFQDEIVGIEERTEEAGTLYRVACVNGIQLAAQAAAIKAARELCVDVGIAGQLARYVRANISFAVHLLYTQASEKLVEAQDAEEGPLTIVPLRNRERALNKLLRIRTDFFDEDTGLRVLPLWLIHPPSDCTCRRCPARQ